MQRADEKTTVPNPSAATDGEQSLFKEPDASIADFPLPDNEDFSDDFFRRINDPGFLPTYSMPELYGSIFHSKPPIIQNLLYPGTYLFAGAPKIGKSFLMAQLAFHVSSGKPLWNFAVQQGTVLYGTRRQTRFCRRQHRWSRRRIQNGMVAQRSLPPRLVRN